MNVPVWSVSWHLYNTMSTSSLSMLTAWTLFQYLDSPSCHKILPHALSACTSLPSFDHLLPLAPPYSLILQLPSTQGRDLFTLPEPHCSSCLSPFKPTRTHQWASLPCSPIKASVLPAAYIQCHCNLQHPSSETRPPVRKAAPSTQPLCPQVLTTPLTLTELGFKWKCPNLAPLLHHIFINSCFIIVSSKYLVWLCPVLPVRTPWSCPCFFLQHDLLILLPSSQCIQLTVSIVIFWTMITATWMYLYCTQIFFLITHLHQHPPNNAEASCSQKPWYYQPTPFWFIPGASPGLCLYHSLCHSVIVPCFSYLSCKVLNH